MGSQKLTSLLALALTLVLCLGCLSGCGGDKQPPETTAPPTGTPTEAIPDAQPGLTTGLYTYNYDVDGTTYDTYFKFYDNGVFYYSTMRAGIIVIGTYEVKDDPFAASSPANREDAVAGVHTDYNTPQTMYFYNMDGAPIGSAGYQENELLCGLTLEGNLSFSENIVLRYDITAVPGENGCAEEFGQKVAHYYDPEHKNSSFIDIMHDGTFQDLMGEMMVDGTWTKDGNTYTLTEADATESYTLVVEGETAVYTDTAGKSMTLYTDVKEDPAGGDGSEILFSFESGWLNLDCCVDGSLKFSFPDYGVEEIGTWIWEDWTFKAISPAGKEYVGTIDENKNLVVNYVSDSAAELTDSFTAASSVWGAAFNGEGSYTPVAATTVPLFAFSIEGDWLGLECYADGTSMFSYPDMGLEERGTWTWSGWTFTLVSAAGKEYVGAIDESRNLVVTYVADASEQLSGTFSCGSDVWGVAFGGQGDYTPAG